METEILSTIGSIAGTAKSVAEAVKSIRAKSGGDPKIETAVANAQELVLTLQSRLLELQEKAIHLQEENAKLRGTIREYESRALEREKYERKKIGTSWVVVPNGESEPLLCPTCFEGGNIVYLSPLPRDFVDEGFGTHTCPTCKARLDLGGR